MMSTNNAPVDTAGGGQDLDDLAFLLDEQKSIEDSTNDGDDGDADLAFLLEQPAPTTPDQRRKSIVSFPTPVRNELSEVIVTRAYDVSPEGYPGSTSLPAPTDDLLVPSTEDLPPPPPVWDDCVPLESAHEPALPPPPPPPQPQISTQTSAPPPPPPPPPMPASHAQVKPTPVATQSPPRVSALSVLNSKSPVSGYRVSKGLPPPRSSGSATKLPLPRSAAARSLGASPAPSESPVSKTDSMSVLTKAAAELAFEKGSEKPESKVLKAPVESNSVALAPSKNAPTLLATTVTEVEEAQAAKGKASTTQKQPEHGVPRMVASMKSVHEQIGASEMRAKSPEAPTKETHVSLVNSAQPAVRSAVNDMTHVQQTVSDEHSPQTRSVVAAETSAQSNPGIHRPSRANEERKEKAAPQITPARIRRSVKRSVPRPKTTSPTKTVGGFTSVSPTRGVKSSSPPISPSRSPTRSPSRSPSRRKLPKVPPSQGSVKSKGRSLPASPIAAADSPIVVKASSGEPSHPSCTSPLANVHETAKRANAASPKTSTGPIDILSDANDAVSPKNLTPAVSASTTVTSAPSPGSLKEQFTVHAQPPRNPTDTPASKLCDGHAPTEDSEVDAVLIKSDMTQAKTFCSQDQTSDLTITTAFTKPASPNRNSQNVGAGECALVVTDNTVAGTNPQKTPEESGTDDLDDLAFLLDKNEDEEVSGPTTWNTDENSDPHIVHTNAGSINLAKQQAVQSSPTTSQQDLISESTGADDMTDLGFLLNDTPSTSEPTVDAKPPTEDLDDLAFLLDQDEKPEDGQMPTINIADSPTKVTVSTENSASQSGSPHEHIHKASSMPDVESLREEKASDPEAFAEEDAARRASWFLPRWRQPGENAPEGTSQELGSSQQRGNSVEIRSSYNFEGTHSGRSPKPKQRNAYKRQGRYGARQVLECDASERIYDTASAKEVGAAVQSAFADLDDERTTESPEQDLSGGVDGEYANIRGLLAPRRLSARKRTRFGQQPTTKNGTKHAVFRLRGHDLTVTELNVPSIPHSIAKIHGRHITRLDVSGGTLCDFGVLVQFKVLQSLVADRNVVVSLDTFPAIRTLERLSLANNKIEDWHRTGEQAQDRFPKLSQLTLAGNPCCPPLDAEDETREYRVTLAEILPTVRLLDGSPITNVALEAQMALQSDSKENTEPISTPPDDAVSPQASDESAVEEENGDTTGEKSDTDGDMTDPEWGTFSWMFGRRSTKPRSRPTSRPGSRPHSSQKGLLPQDNPEVNTVAASAAGKLSKGIISRSEYEHIAKILQAANSIGEDPPISP